MEFIEFEKIFKNELKNNNINDNINVRNYYEYMKLILDWNKKINLTAIVDQKEFLVKHFVDSLTILDFINTKSKIIDVGTGAGFPGIPLKLYDDSLSLTLIDSVNKKINVLNDVIEKLKLNNIKAIHTRAEDFANDIKNREQFDYAVSRAVSNMSTLVEYLLPFVRIGGKVVCMKGPNYNEELQEAEKGIDILGGKIEIIKNININKDLERNIIVIKKIKNTPKKYPRGQGKPLKEPIK